MVSLVRLLVLIVMIIYLYLHTRGNFIARLLLWRIFVKTHHKLSLRNVRFPQTSEKMLFQLQKRRLAVNSHGVGICFCQRFLFARRLNLFVVIHWNSLHAFVSISWSCSTLVGTKTYAGTSSYCAQCKQWRNHCFAACVPQPMQLFYFIVFRCDWLVWCGGCFWCVVWPHARRKQ